MGKDEVVAFITGLGLQQSWDEDGGLQAFDVGERSGWLALSGKS